MIRTDDQLLDLAFEIFQQMAPEQLNPQEYALFQQHFAEFGEVAIFDTADNWHEEIGVLIDETQFAEVWIGLNRNNEEVMQHVFAKCLIALDRESDEFHIIW